ncbi:hypothetical protein ASPBRDRAFT_47741 [Aspergillus brasiliensis CBS 101740]|uniref:Uncharacterized protein n=1 Tax=Aspergillus brasiliensis (strain CBS 101740 / IMI 381727 / IBT 21946) TaxID=767769 RepID=A0A1L9U7P5_ASPBC|nr:hypothetical protein ASPBRDRAFT_47741 [Aspergillus brasiliensis CBS 101740]
MGSQSNIAQFKELERPAACDTVSPSSAIMVCSSGFSGYLLCLIFAEYSTGDKRQQRITPRLLSAAPAAEEMDRSQHSGPGDQSY